MIYSSGFSAILDANVLYPAPLMDFLLNLAAVQLWTGEIHDEWIRNLLLKRTDLKKEQLQKAKQAMDSAFPDSMVNNYSDLINSLTLPDEKDRHVLAAAIRTNAAKMNIFTA